MSESDAAFSVTSLGQGAELDAPALLRAAGKPATAKIEQVSVDEFFGYVVQDQAYHTAADRLVVQRYRALVAFLNTSLTERRVFRVGEIDIDVYVVGRSSDGEWLGVATKLVET